MKKRNFWLTLTCIFAVALLNVGFLYQYRYIIDAIAAGDRQAFVSYFVLMGLTILVMLVFEYIRQIANVSYLNQVGFQLQATFIGKIFDLPFRQFVDQGAVAYISQLNNDLETVKEDYYDAFFTIFQGACTFGIASLALLSLDGLTAIFLILISFLPVVIPYLFKKRRRLNQEAISDSQQVYTTRVSDVFLSYLQVKNSHQRQQVLDGLNDRYQAVNDKVNQATRTTVTMRLLVGLVFYLTTLSIIFIGGFQVLSDALTAILTISEQLVDPINSIAAAFLDRHAVKKLKQEFELSTLGQEAKGQELASAFQSMQLVKASYALGEKQVFEDLTVRFERGKKYLILGESGSGKSSLALILTKNSQLQAGDIYFDQISLSDLSYQAIQDKIAYLPQEGALFHDRVLYNLTMGREVPEDRLMFLIKTMNLDSRFPSYASLSEEISDDSGLSGGQKQRLLLIRALLQDKDILLLDESLSALDQETYTVIEAYLTSLADKTLIHISHRVSDEVLSRYDGVVRIGESN
ncbi:TPA: ABC transporter ATP-binding protein [Streptococcus suis]|uniref:ABC transporter ATP-binding protein n=1 Tax=Streptococcus suis TaxID=1307 RepID=UPI002A8E0EF2|nr:ABC transporter ATP-binding protein [Streptococcus suis]MDY7593946.1 ABC transporter ATP-binding protein [Streptococcus suis]HEL2254710.1 ABC transporter ATP-binding protein [Streptococcus suis]HEL2297978.1 ABC transporter ATP-binding protein [Streptococcus suis]HEL2406329.1 ABC transporter ATP-binding protein [Streptococcus suis]HEM4551454.1 ABC transporter ATP-binding protein [Streptococcus suis]